MTSLPNPLAPSDCDLRDFPYMPLDVARLRDSDLATLETPEACWAAVLLWCASWHRVPAGSLPDDDRVLAKITGYQHAPEKWQSIRDGALRGWIKCADDRLYHPVVAEKASEAWLAKHRHSHGKLVDRVRKVNKARVEKHLAELEVPSLEDWISAGRPLEKDLFPPESKPRSAGGAAPSAGKTKPSGGIPPEERRNEAGIPPENALKGEGKGEGEVNKGCSGGVGSSNGVGPVDNSAEPPPLSADEIGEYLAQWEADRGKVLRLNQHARDELGRLAERSVCEAQLLGAYRLACERRAQQQDASPINPAFVASFLDEALAAGRATGVPPGWDETAEGVRAKAGELGIPSQQGGEDWIWFRRRVIKADGDPRLVEREVAAAERMNLNEFERVYHYFYGCQPPGLVV